MQTIISNKKYELNIEFDKHIRKLKDITEILHVRLPTIYYPY